MFQQSINPFLTMLCHLVQRMKHSELEGSVKGDANGVKKIFLSRENFNKIGRIFFVIVMLICFYIHRD